MTRSTIRRGDLGYTVVANALGLRGREPAPRRPGEYRVLFLGDSMVFGDWLEEDETLPARVEVLAAERAHAVCAYNGAFLGLNTVHELLMARQLAPEVRPDHVILGYFVGNDPLANTLAGIDSGGSYVYDGEASQRLGATLTSHLRPWLLSHAFRVVALRYYVPHLRYSWSAREDVLERSCDLLIQMRDECRARGMAFTVLLIYPRDGVAGGLRGQLSGSRSVGQRLAGRLRARGIEVIDSAPLAQGSDADRRCYFPADGHLNALGANLLAEIVTRQVFGPRLSAPAR